MLQGCGYDAKMFTINVFPSDMLLQYLSTGTYVDFASLSVFRRTFNQQFVESKWKKNPKKIENYSPEPRRPKRSKKVFWHTLGKIPTAKVITKNNCFEKGKRTLKKVFLKVSSEHIPIKLIIMHSINLFVCIVWIALPLTSSFLNSRIPIR